ncbi:MAG: hypothetical protein M3Q45_08575, partial [Chloroflexota bacterium]|nr:hypothetical protein [Chloroflexota bacterium]
MRLFRLIGLVAALAAAYVAQYIFEYHSLAVFFPDWLLNAYPTLARFTRWLPADLFSLALWLAALAALSVGLLTPPWRSMPWQSIAREAQGWQSYGPMRRPWQKVGRWATRIGILLALITAVVIVAYLWRTGNENRWLQSAWTGAVLLYLFSQVPTNSTLRAGRSNGLSSTTPATQRTYLLFILLGTVFLLAWPLTAVPVAIDADIAGFGLQAKAMANGADVRLFSADGGNLTRLALMPTALILWLVDDALLATHLAGVFAGLLMVGATWLVGSELFRRTPMLGYFSESLEDNGQWLALLAASIVAVNG